MARKIDRFRHPPTPERPVAPPPPPLFYRDGRKLDDAERGIAPPEGELQGLPRLLEEHRAREADAKAPPERITAFDQVFDVMLLIGELLNVLAHWLTFRRLFIGLVLLAMVKGCLAR